MEALLQDEDYCQIKSLTSFITSTFVLIFSMTSFLQTLDAYNNMIANENQINYLFNNWERNYFEDVLVLDKGQTCPEGFDYLLDFLWTGTDSGCHCIKENGKEKLHHGACDIKQIRKNCTTLKEIKPTTFNTIEGSTVCVKRYAENFLQVHRPDTHGH